MMRDETPSDSESNAIQTGHPILAVTGVAATLFATVLTVRVVWEETFLTMRQGPQMIGFSLAHGSGAILFISPLILAVWLTVAVVVVLVALFRKRRVSTALWCCLGSAILVFGVISLQPVFYQWLFVGSFAKSIHAPDLMVYAAGEGDARTVRRYLAAGVPIESHNYEGSTPAFAAARGGNTTILQMLTAQGANLNALNDYGDSPLEAASRNHRDAASNFLKAHGAVQVKGTEEQRQAASNAIVRRDIERMNTH